MDRLLADIAGIFGCPTLLGCATFWSAVSAIASVVSALVTVFALAAIFLVWRQLRFDAWIKAQEIFTDRSFTEARGRIFARLEDQSKPWTEKEEEDGVLVCRRMDELARLAEFIGETTILKTWGDQIGNSWIVLEPLVVKERQHAPWFWSKKWEAFETFGEKAAKRIRPGRANSTNKAG